jgi:hypothetical protein
MRAVMNPTFTPAKLKEVLRFFSNSSCLHLTHSFQLKMTSTFNKCTERLVNMINDKLDQEINITEFTDAYTMDILWNSAFGRSIFSVL